MKATLIVSLFLSVSLTCGAVDQPYTVVHFDTANENLQTFLADEQGKPFKTFAQLSTWLQGKGKKLTFAMNAGMYHRDLSPVGLLVVAGKQVSPLNTSAGRGNFFLAPNGVFLLTSSGPKVVATGE